MDRVCLRQHRHMAVGGGIFPGGQADLCDHTGHGRADVGVFDGDLGAGGFGQGGVTIRLCLPELRGGQSDLILQFLDLHDALGVLLGQLLGPLQLRLAKGQTGGLLVDGRRARCAGFQNLQRRAFHRSIGAGDHLSLGDALALGHQHLFQHPRRAGRERDDPRGIHHAFIGLRLRRTGQKGGQRGRDQKAAKGEGHQESSIGKRNGQAPVRPGRGPWQKGSTCHAHRQSGGHRPWSGPDIRSRRRPRDAGRSESRCGQSRSRNRDRSPAWAGC